ncbi:MAG: metal-dependent hydrolase [Thermoguttaceae bacterium]|jgi:membrane-bound metal-dependent hydrolase YbcI (DUF457 family)
MANFQTHLTLSSLVGAGYGAAAFFHYGLPGPTCALAGGLCAVSGMLPDLDAGDGIPLRESTAFAAALVPMMLVHRLQQFDLTREGAILLAGALYLIIRFGGAELLRLLTVHRGMFHSLPAAAIFGELAFLLTVGVMPLRLYEAGAVVLGYVSHLFLDELYSLRFSPGRLHPARSLGSAVKLFGKGWLANLATYALLAAVTYVAVNEPVWTQRLERVRTLRRLVAPVGTNRI